MTLLLSSVTGILLLAALVFTLLSANGKAALWIAVLLIIIANLLAFGLTR